MSAADRKIVEMWMGCETQEAIAEAVNTAVQTVNNVIADFSNSVLGNQNGKLAALAAHAVDFTPPLYNIWKQQEKSAGPTHFGNSEVRWVDNLLYLYTKPLGAAAGGGDWATHGKRG